VREGKAANSGYVHRDEGIGGNYAPTPLNHWWRAAPRGC
jgi:hypothetical protein